MTSKLKEGVMQGVFTLCACVSILAVALICIFLFAYAIGLTLNLSNWAYFSSLTGVSIGDVQLFAWILCGLTAVMCLVFILFQFKREGVKLSWAAPNGQVEEALNFEKAPAISLLTPIVPIVLVVAFSWTIVAALFAGIAFNAVVEAVLILAVSGIVGLVVSFGLCKVLRVEEFAVLTRIGNKFAGKLGRGKKGNHAA